MEKLIALVFLGAELSRRMHLRTASRSDHVALQSLYESLGIKADRLAEVWMGYKRKKLADIPLLDNEFEGDITDVLEQQAAWIEDNRPDEPSFILNIVDEILADYYAVIYQLRELA